MKKNLAWVAAAALLGAPNLLANHVVTTYTLDADFAQGTLSGVNYTTVANQLQLNTVATTFPVMWVANAGEDTVSKVDTNLNREIARYRTWFGPAGQPGYVNHLGSAYSGAAPSRTAVDLDGNAYVLNRHFDGRRPVLIKIAAEGGIDRNGNGVIDTSTDTNGNGLVEPAEMLNLADANANGVIDPSEIQDERILWAVQVGTAGGLGRALCIGTDGNLWVGMYNQLAYYKHSAVDGSLIAGPVGVPWSPYGCAVDQGGVLWSASLGSILGKISNTGANSGPYPVQSFFHRGNYGIALGNGRVYLGSSNQQFDPATNTFSEIPNLDFTAGIVVDGAGNIIGGQYDVRKVSPAGALLWASPSQQGGGFAIGIQVDANNDVWQISFSNSRVYKYRGIDGAPLGSVAVGNTPYTYSDATGLAARSVTTNSGLWTVVRDGGAAATPWLDVAWNQVLPVGSSIAVRVRAADTMAGLPLAAYVPVASGMPLAGVSGRFLQVEARLNANLADESPILLDLAVRQGHTNVPPVAANDAFVTPEDAVLVVAAPGVLGNDTDADLADTRTAILVTGPSQGVLAFNADGSFTYTPGANFHGADSFTYKVRDSAGEESNVATVSLMVSPVNDLPVANADAATTPEDGSVTTAVAANDTDADGDALAVNSFTHGANGLVSCSGGSCAYTPSPNFNGTDSYTYTVSDGNGGTATATVTVVVSAVNDAPGAPNISASAPSILENGMAGIGVSFLDVDGGDTHAATIDWGDGTVEAIPLGTATFFGANHQYLDDNAADSYTVVVTVTDAAGASASSSFPIGVANVAPVIAAVTGPEAPVAAGTPALVEATFSDVGTLDTHTCTFSWDDGTPDTVVAASGGTCYAPHAYAAANVYEVLVTVTDDDGGAATEALRYVVVYDASAGFVTGGGWITSPAGAYAPDPSATGRANFGFVSKYKPGQSVPSGNTEFQFKAGNMNFKSSAYEWMVISGQKARYRGTGTVNGGGSFSFELTAWDGDRGDPDRIRMQVWDGNRGNALFYDNEAGNGPGADPTTALGGGSIQIHR